VLKKRLVGVITVRDGWAVQSFGYSRYLPLGRPEVLAENLDRWGADEILLQCIDRSNRQLGPDLELLHRIAEAGLSTPLIYAGGIRSVEDAVAAVRAGADRVCIDALLHDDIAAASRLGGPLGAQAIIAALPLSQANGGVAWFDYRTKATTALPPALLDLLKTGALSEALIIDHEHEGSPGAFDPGLLDLDLGVPLIAFGGISEPEQIAQLLGRESVGAVAIGNFLSYREHAVQAYRLAVDRLPLREPIYERPLAIS
jgi:imidazole glycerol-phosphate synthase subunit HisF